MCGMRKSLASPVDFAEVDIVHQAVAGVDARQGIGRLRCRQVEKGGRHSTCAFPSESLCHVDGRTW